MSMPSSSAGHRLPLSSVAATVVQSNCADPQGGPGCHPADDRAVLVIWGSGGCIGPMRCYVLAAPSCPFETVNPSQETSYTLFALRTEQGKRRNGLTLQQQGLCLGKRRNWPSLKINLKTSLIWGNWREVSLNHLRLRVRSYF